MRGWDWEQGYRDSLSKNGACDECGWRELVASWGYRDADSADRLRVMMRVGLASRSLPRSAFAIPSVRCTLASHL